MFYLVIVLLVISSVKAEAVNVILRHPNNDTRIIGGQPIDITKAPYQVAILYDNELGCGGSVISDSLILTAGHCLLGTNGIALSVRAGSSRHASGGQLRNVLTKSLNPKYNAKTSNNDIAILKLRSPLIFNQFVMPVKLPSDNVRSESNTNCRVSGFGITRESAINTSKVLREVSVQIIPLSKCVSTYQTKQIEITSNMLCAGVANGGKDACQGDSGGPLVCNGTQFGIVSMGEGCGRAKFPGVYTSVEKELAWIKEVISKRG